MTRPSLRFGSLLVAIAVAHTGLRPAATVVAQTHELAPVFVDQAGAPVPDVASTSEWVIPETALVATPPFSAASRTPLTWPMRPSRTRCLLDALDSWTGWIDPWGHPLPKERYVLEPATFQILPDGLLYPGYLAGPRQSRIGTTWVHADDHGWYWDATLGGYMPVFRWGTSEGPLPEGYQLDIEGAGLLRLDLESDRDLTTSDFRFGIPWTSRFGRVETKLAYYHLSSHLGDEFMLDHTNVPRINYVRDVIVAGIAFRPTTRWRLYAEAGWAFFNRGGSEPWEFQFGAEYSNILPDAWFGSPFLVANAHLNQERNFGGVFTLQAGWQWRGRTGHLFRTGIVYQNGASYFYQFAAQHETLLGLGLWYDY